MFLVMDYIDGQTLDDYLYEKCKVESVKCKVSGGLSEDEVIRLLKPIAAALGIAGMGNYIGAGLQSIISGYLIKRAEDGSASLVGHTFANGWNLDYLAVFWIGMAALSVVCVLLAGKGRGRRSLA